ncbi:MAG TPA: FkbM family methyltransferase, partial [Cyclobacteriaceae bacterium]
GMIFTNEMRRLGHSVLAIDIDDLKNLEDYYRVAIGGQDKRVGIKRTADPQATSICQGDEVMCMTLNSLCKMARVDFFDLIKMDIEGSEYEVIMSLDKAPARQISIEYHLHTGVYGENEMLLMENKLLYLGYFPVQHDKTKQHGLSYNYWDSLWILQGAIA